MSTQTAGRRLAQMKSSIFAKVRAQIGPAPTEADASQQTEPVDESLVARVRELDQMLDELAARVSDSRQSIPAQTAKKEQERLDAALEGDGDAGRAGSEVGSGRSDGGTWTTCLQRERLEDLAQAFELTSTLMAQLMVDLPRELTKWRHSVKTAEAALAATPSQNDAVIRARRRLRPLAQVPQRVDELGLAPRHHGADARQRHGRGVRQGHVRPGPGRAQ